MPARGHRAAGFVSRGLGRMAACRRTVRVRWQTGTAAVGTSAGGGFDPYWCVQAYVKDEEPRDVAELAREDPGCAQCGRRRLSRRRTPHVSCGDPDRRCLACGRRSRVRPAAPRRQEPVRTRERAVRRDHDLAGVSLTSTLRGRKPTGCPSLGGAAGRRGHPSAAPQKSSRLCRRSQHCHSGNAQLRSPLERGIHWSCSTANKPPCSARSCLR
jgi:hypothetical protein